MDRRIPVLRYLERKHFKVGDHTHKVPEGKWRYTCHCGSGDKDPGYKWGSVGDLTKTTNSEAKDQRVVITKGRKQRLNMDVNFVKKQQRQVEWVVKIHKHLPLKPNRNRK